MKNISKIISLIPVASSAIAVPFAITACNAELIEPIEMHDLTKEFVPETQHEVAFWNQTEATKNYIEDVKQNPQIFEDDACWAAKQLIPVASDNLEFSFGVSKPKFGKTYIWQYGGDDYEYSTITATQRFHYQISESIPGSSFKMVWSIDLDVWYDNVVFYAFENAEDDDHGVWSLGLFDYSVGDEAFWPFVSNTEPWSIRYSCKSLENNYYIDAETGEDILIDNKASYYTGNINGGKTLIELIDYWKSLNPEDTDYYGIMEKQIISIILFDYKSYYLLPVQNIPEVKQAHTLISEYDISQQNLNLLLNGLIFIRPTYFKEEWLGDANTDPQFIIKMDNEQSYLFTHHAEETPIRLHQNGITISKDGQLVYGGKYSSSEYRYSIMVPATLSDYWDIDPQDLTKPIKDVLFVSGGLRKIPLKMYAVEGSDAAEYFPDWTIDDPHTQDVYLNYDYILQNIGAINN